VTATWERPDHPGEARWATLVLVSLGLHVGGFVFAVTLPRILPRRAAGPPVYVVDLVTLPAGLPSPSPAPPAAATARSAPPKPEPPVKIPERAAKKPEPKKPEPKKTPPKETVKKPDPKPETPRPDPGPQPAPAAESAAAATASAPPAGTTAGTAGSQGATGTRPGGAGGTDTGAADDQTFYFGLLNRKIRGAWKKPIFPPNHPAGRTLEARVRLTLTSSGRVIEMDLVASSGYDALDRSALRAVQDAQPFPPFPYTLGTEPRPVVFEFALIPGEE
jgi:TonB family protein